MDGNRSRSRYNGVMLIKDEVLDLLLSRKGERISGQEIADALSCSRMAVSKSVAQLQEEGFDIETQKGSGYVLSRADVLSPQVLSPLFPIPVHAVGSCRSTMIEAKDLINRGRRILLDRAVRGCYPLSGSPDYIGIACRVEGDRAAYGTHYGDKMGQ